MAQQELDLLQLTAAAVAQFCTGATQVVRSNVLYSRPFAASLHYIPDHVLRDAFAPHFSGSADRSENPGTLVAI